MKRVKITYKHWYPKLFKIGGITLYPHIWLYDEKECTPLKLIRHEMVHVSDIRRIGVFAFYLSYLFQMMWGLVKYRSFWEAYRNVSFEVEARKKETTHFTGQEADELGFINDLGDFQPQLDHLNKCLDRRQYVGDLALDK